MTEFTEIKPNEITANVFTAIGGDWMLITAGDKQKANTMTAAWGGMGVMWNRNVVFAVIRPQRYTKEFVDKNDTFSLSFLSGEYKKQLGYLGTVSGRDEDKIKKSGLTPAFYNDTPYFEESNMAIICKKLFVQPYQEASFLFPDMRDEWYPERDYHTLYIAEIISVLKR